MGKIKNPLLSLNAHGTLADRLTYQKVSGIHIVREKPHLPYSLTLPQQYQRWLYQDYSELWKQQTAAVKRQWQIDSAGKNITPFALWMRYYLQNMPDIIAQWRMDEDKGAVVSDSGKGDLPGTVFGATPQTGIISRGRGFDGLDDHVNFGNSPLLDAQVMRSYDFWYYMPVPYVSSDVFFATSNTINTGVFARTVAGGKVAFQVNIAGRNYRVMTGGLTPATWTHICCLIQDTANIWINLNGVLASGGIFEFAWAADYRSFQIGSCPVTNALPLAGIIDHFTIYNRILTLSDVQRHSLRRYSL